jgi:hypothetical protein
MQTEFIHHTLAGPSIVLTLQNFLAGQMASHLRSIHLKFLHGAARKLCSMNDPDLHMAAVPMTPSRSRDLAYLPVQTPQTWRAKDMAISGPVVP